MKDDYIPLAERMRPRSLDEVVGQDHIVGKESLLRKALDSGKPFSTIFWGPPGSGKTTLARLIAHYTGLPFYSFSAVTSGLRELRDVVDGAKRNMDMFGKPTILFVDEIHRFNKAQQDGFLPFVENGLIVLIGATTENPSFEIIPPLLSRSKVLILNPLSYEDMKKILLRAIEDKERGIGNWDIKISEDVIDYLIELSHGDARVGLNNLEHAALFAKTKGEKEITKAAIDKLLPSSPLPYDKSGEEHYNLISAFHKSLRGSDPQASLYWLYRMLMAGEDPLFIARRMIRFASEDVGLADPQALGIAIAAFEAWEKVGPPEAELALAEAAVYLSMAPKSNSLYMSEKAIKEEIKKSGPLPVPLHIRNAPTPFLKRIGYGKGYMYPHNFKDAWVDQQYLPDRLKGRIFYNPSIRGFEREIKRRMERLNKRRGG